jgi:glycerol kinase
VVSRQVRPGEPAAPGGCVASYAVEGTVNAAATALDWVQRRFRIDVRTAGIDAYLASALGPAPGAAPRGLHFLPAISGLGAPRWDPGARPRFVGEADGAGAAAHLAAAVESIAQRCAEIVRAARRDASIRASRRKRTAVRASGGLVRCVRLLQMQADLLQRPITVGTVPDASALGAARLAAPLETRLHTPEIGADVTVLPAISADAAAALARRWERAVYGRGGGGPR